MGQLWLFLYGQMGYKEETEEDFAKMVCPKGTKLWALIFRDTKPIGSGTGK